MSEMRTEELGAKRATSAENPSVRRLLQKLPKMTQKRTMIYMCMFSMKTVLVCHSDLFECCPIIIWGKMWIICQDSLPLKYDLPSDLGNRKAFKLGSRFVHNIMARNKIL